MTKKVSDIRFSSKKAYLLGSDEDGIYYTYNNFSVEYDERENTLYLIHE